MSSEFLAVSGIIFILIFLGVVFYIPSERKVKKKKKKNSPVVEPVQVQKDWEQRALRLEKHIQSLRDEILVLQKGEKVIEKHLVVEKVKVKKLQEKLSQEREWHKREQESIDKKGSEFQQLKMELVNVQEIFSNEHAANLRFENQVKELKEGNDALTERRRTVEGENAKAKAKIENNKKEIVQLKKENTQFKKKKEDTSWIAKSEYERVERLLKEKEKELARINRESKK